MSAHLRYLRYVLLHKWYVFTAGCVIGGYSPRWLWRLIVHDLSKFSRAEWTPYVCMFYGERPDAQAEREVKAHERQYGDSFDDASKRDRLASVIATRAKFIVAERQRDFNAAWLHHIHKNPHHWQHWILRQDDGREIVLIPPNADVNEMVADWLGAGRKIERHPTMAECVAETIVWYAKAHATQMMRRDVREHVERTLVGLARHYNLDAFVVTVERAAAQRATLSL